MTAILTYLRLGDGDGSVRIIDGRWWPWNKAAAKMVVVATSSDRGDRRRLTNVKTGGVQRRQRLVASGGGNVRHLAAASSGGVGRWLGAAITGAGADPGWYRKQLVVGE
ncbi:unnamed protein product, partial [Cuscuta europaea]